MSWLKDLYDTYEAQTDAVGKYDDKGENPLLPVAHKLENTQVTITLGIKGNFLDAQAADLRDTIIPCSERSQGRTSGVAAHPLVDSLSYLAQDFGRYCAYSKCTDSKTCEETKCKDCKDRSRHLEKHDDYLASLKKWTTKTKHPRLIPVYNYIKGETIINDLVTNKVLFLDDEKRLAKSWRGKKEDKPAIFSILSNYSQKKQEDIAVRWIIKDKDGLHKLWEDPTLHASWIDFVLKNASSHGLCLISSNSNAALSTAFPRDIRKGGDGAKLISANDHENFTYKGKFENERIEQVATLGLEENQKAHAALKWLLKKQGYNSYETFALVAWGLNHTGIPQPMGEDDLFNDLEEENVVDTKEGIGRRIASQIRGYSAKLPSDEFITVLAIDAPIKDKGRSSVVHYSKHHRSDYFDKLESWHNRAAWRHYSPKSKSYFLGAPSPKHIAEACYQRKVTEKNQTVWKTDPKILSRTIKEILPCIIESRSIPKQLLKILIERSSKRGSYKKSDNPKNNDQWIWEKTLAVTCSLYKHQTTKEYTMALNTTETSRDYLYGRLLAIADRLEEYALYKQATHLLDDEDEKKKAGKSTRLSNAARLMYVFSKKPYTTWQHLHDKLIPYIERLSKHGSDNFYLSQIQEVMSLFEPEDFKKNTPLSGEYLLAFYCQRKQLQPTNTKNTTHDNQ